ncbi:hypothetical protein [Streptomyces sp. c-19]|uniref:hypothetical protein n=1 Tax=Streptomyces sp. c-19 TaxID=2789275 RepID=UPI00397F61D0
MRPVRLRRPALAGTTACLALLVTACGGEREGAEPGGAAGGAPTAGASATSAPSTAKDLPHPQWHQGPAEGTA